MKREHWISFAWACKFSLSSEARNARYTHSNFAPFSHLAPSRGLGLIRCDMICYGSCMHGYDIRRSEAGWESRNSKWYDQEAPLPFAGLLGLPLVLEPLVRSERGPPLLVGLDLPEAVDPAPAPSAAARSSEIIFSMKAM